MKTVLWISRHQMTEDQFQSLERVMGGAVRLQQWPDTVTKLTALLPALRQADAVAAVLPVELLSELIAAADGKPVLIARSERRPVGHGAEQEFEFVHRCWVQILRLELSTREL